MLTLPKDTDKLLLEFLRNSNTISEEQISEAETFAKAISSGVIDALIQTNAINEEQIADNFCSSYGLSRSKVRLSNIKVRPLQDTITDQFIIKKRIVPVDKSGDKVYVAVADPSALESFNNMQVISNANLVEASVVSLSEMQEYLETLKSKMDDDFLRSLEAQTDEDDENILTQTGATKNNNVIPDYLLGIDEEKKEKKSRIIAGTDVIDFVESILSNAIAMGVSDIHIEPFRENAQVRYRKDGVLQVMEEFTDFLNLNYSAVIARLKILANLDISERRLPQDGAITSQLAEKSVDLRVSILPTVNGERVVMRILDPDAANFTLNELGIPEENLKKLRKAIHSPQGMLLVTGPTGSGKSTTLYAALKEINKPGVNILTAEDPVEYDLKGVGQVQVRDNIGLSFAAALRSFLRQDPEVIMVGEIRDKETSDIAIKAALTGHMVMSTLHTNDAASTITRLLNMGVPSYLITSALNLVLAQRLARKNCPHCLADDNNVKATTLIELGFSEEEVKNFKPQKSKGCDRCNDTGIKGRVGIHEILPVNARLKEAILSNATEAQMVEVAKKDGFETLQEVGRRFIREGKISVEEYKRVLVLD
ncbi:MAG: ATPase, T2SS/T4P/T4SS family [Rickettsiales bacterium]|nr:ATPase, T2SS/T4P/T4SS family [Rickettsiales bacterium]